MKSAEKYRKTPEEKVALINARSRHKRLLRKAGFDPKKRINISSPITALFTALD